MKKFLVLSMFLGVMFAGEVVKDTIYSDKEMKVIVERIKPEPVIVEKIVYQEKVVTEQIVDEQEVNNLKDQLDKSNAKIEDMCKSYKKVVKKVDNLNKEIGKENVCNGIIEEEPWYTSVYAVFCFGFILGRIIF